MSWEDLERMLCWIALAAVPEPLPLCLLVPYTLASRQFWERFP